MRTNIPGSCGGVNDILPEPGAIREWHRELREGLRNRTDVDALSRAACAEANAREWNSHPPTCNEYRRQAAAILGTARLELATAKLNVATRTPAVSFSKLRPTKVCWSIPKC